MARHFLELQDARTLSTDHLLLARRAVRDAAQANAMAVVHGEAGLGKTFAVDHAIQAVGRPTIWATFPARPTPRLVAATLLEQLTGRPTRLDRFRAVARVVELLAQDDRVVVVDESQLLTGDCIELLRYVHDQPTTRFALVLVGGNGVVVGREDRGAPGVKRYLDAMSRLVYDDDRQVAHLAVRRDAEDHPRLRHRSPERRDGQPSVLITVLPVRLYVANYDRAFDLHGALDHDLDDIDHPDGQEFWQHDWGVGDDMRAPPGRLI